MIANIVIPLGITGMIGLLFTFCMNNRKKIDKNREDFHKIDKKIDVLIATFEIKFPEAFKSANNKVNDNESR